MLKISLVIPAYNEEKYIGSCLEYVQKNAKEKFFEIIVIDNASSDLTKEAALRFKDVRVIQERKKGLAFARERGFLESGGDILAYIDADTKMPKGWYERVEREFQQNTQLACLSGPYIYYEMSWIKKFLVWIYWIFLAYPVYFLIGYMTVGGNFAIRRDVLEKMNGFDKNIKFYGDDTNIARRAYAFGKVKFSLSFIIYSSARRLFKQGFLKTACIYGLNFVTEVFFKKPVTQSHEDIR